MKNRHKIAVLGGTGQEGSGLGARWAKAEHFVIIGSRDAAKASATSEAMSSTISGAQVVGMNNRDAASAADIIVLPVLYTVQRSTLEEVRESLKNKILVDATVPS